MARGGDVSRAGSEKEGRTPLNCEVAIAAIVSGPGAVETSASRSLRLYIPTTDDALPRPGSARRLSPPDRSHSEAGADQVKGSGHGAHLSSTGSIPGGTLRPSTGTPVASGRSCALDGSRQRAPTPPCSGAALSVLREPVAAL